MTEAEIVERIRSYKWDRWLERPFGAFVQSFFEHAGQEESFKKIGIEGVHLRGALFQNRYWYFCDGLIEEMDRELEAWLRTHSIFDVTGSLERFKEASRTRIKELIAAKTPVRERLAEVYAMITSCCTYIWLAHGLESFYQRRLNEEVAKYVGGDTAKFIGDASFPSKKNEHALLEDMMRSEATDEEIAERFAWLRCRDGFAPGFTSEEIRSMRADLKPHEEHEMPDVPPALSPLFEEVRELVYYRTARTDVFYELMYDARPLFKEVAASFGLTFEELREYRSKRLIEGKKERYGEKMAFAYLDADIVFREEPILPEETAEMVKEFKGAVAYKGVARGIVRIVKDVSQIGKVGQGEILVTQMTFPSFLPAMIRAAAFVTDEGGITCHAAIVAREMRKPCVIGTKVATSVLSDGDTVEVDADHGMVRKVEA